MSKIVKKKDLDVLIESTIKKAGITKSETNKVVTESVTPKKVVSEPKELINEDFKKELEKFNKLTNFKY